MFQPVLTLLVASSIQIAAESPRAADLAQIVYDITQAVEGARPQTLPVAETLTVRDLPFYYDDLLPLPVPAVEPVVTYDWRSPTIFDLP
jgi:hypothetical protein